MTETPETNPLAAADSAIQGSALQPNLTESDLTYKESRTTAVSTSGPVAEISAPITAKESILQRVEHWTEEEWEHFKGYIEGTAKKVATTVEGSKPITALESIVENITANNSVLNTIYDDLKAIATKLDSTVTTDVKIAESTIESEVSGIINEIKAKSSTVANVINGIVEIVNILKTKI